MDKEKQRNEEGLRPLIRRHLIIRSCLLTGAMGVLLLGEIFRGCAADGAEHVISKSDSPSAGDHFTNPIQTTTHPFRKFLFN